MKIRVVVVGKVRDPVASVVREYERRAGRYFKLEITEVGGGAGGKSAGAEVIRRAEAERLLAQIPDDYEVIALSRLGTALDSRALAGYLEECGVRSTPGVVFVVGGAHGLGPEILARAKRVLTLSAMTLPHEMARLFLAEQLYRAGTIIRGEPYHKG